MGWFDKGKQKEVWDEEIQWPIGDIEAAHKIRDICRSAAESAEQTGRAAERQDDKKDNNKNDKKNNDNKNKDSGSNKYEADRYEGAAQAAMESARKSYHR